MHDFNDIYCLGYVETMPNRIKKKDMIYHEFDIQVLKELSKPVKIHVLNKIENNLKVISSIRVNDVVLIKGHVQKRHKDDVYIYIIDIIKLNTSSLEKEKAIIRLLSHPEINNNVYIQGTAVDEKNLQVERQSKYKTTTLYDILETEGFQFEAGKQYAISGQLQNDVIMKKEKINC